MYFEKGYIYHIYNQGNNRQKVFFNRDNYLFFLRKVRIHVLPFVDIIAYCLMPNHFHLMVMVKEIEITVEVNGLSPKNRTINDSIGIMLRSYTQAVNKQQNRSGKLFREKTKSECINCPQGLSPSFITQNGVTVINVELPEHQYPQVCFNYIHRNPVKAGLVKKPEDWEFSSAADYAGLRGGTLINYETAKMYVNTNI